MSPDDDRLGPLSQVDIVLVRPRGNRNIGAAARAIANHGLGRLILVDPPAFDPEQARWMAPGAHAVLDAARLVATVPQAVAEHVRVAGTSGRPRRFGWPVRQPWELAQVVLEQPAPTALLFGPEDFGLSNDDLACCTEILTLPTAGHASLNLAQAVTVTASWLLGGWCQARDAAAPHWPLWRRRKMQGLVQDALQVLEATGYLNGRSPLQVRATLGQLLGRLEPTGPEAGMLRGMLKPLRFHLGLLGRRSPPPPPDPA